ncbi:MAG: folylpolyglutamate synthase/dihydrofolate synthase family protein [Bacteroidota bacterium]
MTSTRNTIRYLYGLQHRGMKFGLRNIRALLGAVGHPERLFPSIHIAGTNGKGSTAAFIASAFQEAGYCTGLYTSPHLIRFTERIRINGEEIPEQRLAEYVRTLRPSIDAVGATFFEATTCIAFLYFADEGVDCAVIETGLGGRLDATNVLRPMISVITNVSLEHKEFLGSTVARIAREKGGIIKPGVPVVTASDDPEVLGILRRIALRRRARLWESGRVVGLVGRGRGRISISSRSLRIAGVFPGLRGTFQRRNIALAASTLAVLRRSAHFRRWFPRVGSAALRRGIARVRANTGLRARFEKCSANGTMLIDVAHNPAGIEALVGELSRMKHPPRVAVFGVMRDKEYRLMLGSLRRIVDAIVAVAPQMKRALPVARIVGEARQLGIRCVRGGSVAHGLRRARAVARKGTILVTGSHFVAGEALREVRREDA